jgi:hypothetical protein
MADKKICPMSFNTPIHADILNCKEAKCEFWIDEPFIKEPMCSIRFVGLQLFLLTRTLQALVEKP